MTKENMKNFIHDAKRMLPYERKNMVLELMEIAESLLKLEIDINDAYRSMDFKGMDGYTEAKYKDTMECLAGCRKGLEKT